MNGVVALGSCAADSAVIWDINTSKNRVVNLRAMKLGHSEAEQTVVKFIPLSIYIARRALEFRLVASKTTTENNCLIFNHRLRRCFCCIRRLVIEQVRGCLQYISFGIYALFESCLGKIHVASSTSSSVMFSTPEYGKRCAHFARLDGRLEIAKTSFSSSARKGTSSEARSVAMCSI